MLGFGIGLGRYADRAAEFQLKEMDIAARREEFLLEIKERQRSFLAPILRKELENRETLIRQQIETVRTLESLEFTPTVAGILLQTGQAQEVIDLARGKNTTSSFVKDISALVESQITEENREKLGAFYATLFSNPTETLAQQSIAAARAMATMIQSDDPVATYASLTEGLGPKNRLEEATMTPPPVTFSRQGSQQVNELDANRYRKTIKNALASMFNDESMFTPNIYTGEIELVGDAQVLNPLVESLVQDISQRVSNVDPSKVMDESDAVAEVLAPLNDLAKRFIKDENLGGRGKSALDLYVNREWDKLKTMCMPNFAYNEVTGLCEPVDGTVNPPPKDPSTNAVTGSVKTF